MVKRLWLTVMLIWLAVPLSYGKIAIYVSPTGDDSNNGTQQAPVKNISHAMTLANDAEGADSVEIRLSEGVFRLSEPVIIDHNTVAAGTHLTISGAGMGQTTVSGGTELPPFKVANDSLWYIDLRGTPFAISDIQHLFVNGHRATLARTPNHTKLMKDYTASQLLVDSVPVRNAKRNGLAIHTVKLPSEAVDALSNLSGPVEKTRITFLHAWDMTRRHIETFNREDSTLFVIGNPQKPWNHIDRDAQFYLENDMSFMDEPGEWFYDRGTAQLYYIPSAGEIPESSVATIPLLDELLIIKGSSERPVNNVTISDLTLAYTKYDISRRGYEPVQAAARMGATVCIGNASDIMLGNCEIAHTGNSAIWLENGSRDSRITHCYLHDLGIGGIKLGHIAKPEDEERDLIRNIVIDNNIIQSGGRVFPTGTGILLTHASDNTITHNDIADFYYSGISAGWTWGYAHSPSKRNTISHNHIHHLGRGVLSDMGGIYTLGPSEGTVISNNVIHHIYSYTYGGWGLYTDEGSSGIIIRNNLVYNCKSSGFHQHYGKDNVVTNNIFINQLRAQLEATLVEDHHSFTFDHNIIYYTGGKMYGIKWDSVNASIDHNAYWNAGAGKTMFNDRTFAEWKQATGHDRHSVIADPKFSDISANDFTIQNTGLMRRIGFKPFDYKSAGVYGDQQWRNLAKLSAGITAEFDSVVASYESELDNTTE